MRSRRHLAVLWFCVIITLELIIMGGSSLGFAATEVRINCGGGQYTDTGGNVWSADTGYNTGNVGSTSAEIRYTHNDTLYQSERWDSSSAPEMAYSIAVPNGDYLVNLHFAEIYDGAAFTGGRIFDVEIEGALVLDNLDIYNFAFLNGALVMPVNATVSDGQIDIVFRHVVEDPKISAIEILSSGDTSAPSETDSLVVTEEGNVGIGTPIPKGKLDVDGSIMAGNSDIYFTKTDHQHIGYGNTSGYAAIENAENYDALMILGRAGTPKGRQVRLWDYLQVNGSMDITGNVGIGKPDPAAKLDVNGKIVMRNQTQDTDSANTVATKGYTDSKIASAATFPASLTQDGYQKFPSGLIIQWGKVNNISSGSPSSVTFPIPFPNAALSISISYSGNNQGRFVYTETLTNSNVTFRASETSSIIPYNPTIYYTAIGH